MADLGDSSEIRSFDFFRTVVGPMLAGHFEEELWRNSIAQISNSEPAIRHAALALSSVIESRVYARVELDGLALQHNNKSINAVLALRDESLILLTCILFICQEWLHGKVRRARAHFYQGLRILESIKQPSILVREMLAPVFCRLWLFPAFFGHAHHVPMSAYWMREWTDIPTRFKSSNAAMYSLAALWVLLLPCIRQSEPVRFGKMPASSLPNSWYTQYATVNELFSKWSTAYTGLVLNGSDTSKCPLRVLWVQYLIARIWLNVALAPTQLAFDDYHANFASIIEHCTFVVENSGLKQNGMFTFDIGIISILEFTGCKCRHAKTRLEALELLRRMGEQRVRENLWDAKTVHDVVKQVIEHEHDCSIENLTKQVELQTLVEMPPNERRVDDFHRVDLSATSGEGVDVDEPSGVTVVLRVRDQAGWETQMDYVTFLR
ncbi:hypothetical protein BP6252_10992 [Coleophoma cylindrospora]|uniref:Transcription factor domain-containing protein n=1 Tax=Coleophoma cylindrospora TaxID=1849047 RepID=A0A3D8QNT1_9HELO|nr:hypothetical protein BP6252_10992 [Coleophoma cylindrospora]